MSNGYNPMRWNCEAEGCYNVKQRPKIEVFAECFSGKINFGDLDAAIVEVNSRALLMEWKGAAGEIPTGQHLTYQNLSRTGLLVAAIVVGNAETMDITHCGFYIGGTFTGWQKSSLEQVKEIFRRWEARARTLPPVEVRKALPSERISKLADHQEWIADYDKHWLDFRGFMHSNKRPA